MRRTALLLALIVVATTCSPAATSPTTPEPTSTVATPTISVSTPTLTPSATPSTAPASGPTPVPRKMMGRATLKTTGAGAAGVRVRVSPMPLSDGRAPGPDATAVTDDSGVVPPGAEATPDPGGGLGAAVAAGLANVEGHAECSSDNGHAESKGRDG